MNGGILYKSKYGSTEQYAQWLSEELHLPILDIDKVSEESVTLHDFFIIGSPIYVGKLMAAAWLRRHETILKNKKIFLFIVCGTPVNDHNKTTQILRDNVSENLEKNSTVYFLPGRIIKHKLSWLDRFLLKVGARVEKDPLVKKHMQEDFDSVERANLHDLVEAVRFFKSHPQSHVDALYSERR